MEDIVFVVILMVGGVDFILYSKIVIGLMLVL